MTWGHRNSSMAACDSRQYHIATEIGDFAQFYFQQALECFQDATAKGYKDSPFIREETLCGGIANSLNDLGRDLEAEKMDIKCIDLETARKW